MKLAVDDNKIMYICECSAKVPHPSLYSDNTHPGHMDMRTRQDKINGKACTHQSHLPQVSAPNAC